jgi:hypothetical protein
MCALTSSCAMLAVIYVQLFPPHLYARVTEVSRSCQLYGCWPTD